MNIKVKNTYIFIILIVGFVFLYFIFQQFPLAVIEKKTGITFSHESGFYEEPFYLRMDSVMGKIYYTLDGTEPSEDSLLYEGPILISDVTENPNEHSIRRDLTAGMDYERVEQTEWEIDDNVLPIEPVDKGTIVKARIMQDGEWSETKTASFFINYESRKGYKNLGVISIVAEPDDLFGFDNGIYVTGKAYDEFVNNVENFDTMIERSWMWWDSNYRRKGREWERIADVQFFDKNKRLVLSQKLGIRIHGGMTRGLNPKSLNIYAREEYDGNKYITKDLLGNGMYATAYTLSQGGNDYLTKSQDYLIHQLLEGQSFSTMDLAPYVMFLNGEYWGVYWLTEKYNKEYIMNHFNVSGDNVIMIKNGQLEEGEESDYELYLEMVEFCSESDMSNEANWEYVCSLIDMDSYIDYYASMIYISRSLDWPLSNEALWRSREGGIGNYCDGRWRWMAFDFNSGSMYNAELDSIETTCSNSDMFNNMMTNEIFRTRILDKLRELGETCFSSECVAEVIWTFRDIMDEPIAENHKRFYGEGLEKEYQAYLENLIQYFELRRKYIDILINEYGNNDNCN